MRRFLAEEEGDTTTGLALGAILVLLIFVVVFVFGADVFRPQPERPGVEIRVGT